MDATKTTEAELVQRIAAGEAAALDDFYQLFRPRILAVARRIVRDEWDAEEVLQDVVWTVHRKIDTFRGDAKFSSWVYRITQNAARMLLRKRKRIPTPIEESDVEGILHNTPGADVSVQPHAVVAQRRAAERIGSRFAELDAMNQRLYTAMDVEGLDKEDVAEELDLSVSAVKARLHRIRKSLRHAAAEASPAA